MSRIVQGPFVGFGFGVGFGLGVGMGIGVGLAVTPGSLGDGVHSGRGGGGGAKGSGNGADGSNDGTIGPHVTGGGARGHSETGANGAPHVRPKGRNDPS